MLLIATFSEQERELHDVLEQYRKVSSERDSAESRYRVTNDESQTLREELASADSDKKRMADRLSALEREISDHLHVKSILRQRFVKDF